MIMLVSVLTVNTGSGYWNPIILLITILIIFLLIYILRSLGRRGFTPSGDKSKAFLSGNKEIADHHIKASNLYWGFTTALSGLYSLARRLHTGDVSDYVLWFIIVLAVSFIISVGVI